jgi:hypothetical protein
MFVDIDMRQSICLRQIAPVFQEAYGCQVSGTVGANQGIYLGSVTGRENDTLGYIVVKGKESILQLSLTDAQLLSNNEWCCAMIYTHHANLHT